MLTIVEDYSRVTWIFLLSNKSQTLARLDTFFKMVETQFAESVKSVRTDNEAEFLSHKSQKLFLALGILHQKSCAYYSQENEVSRESPIIYYN